MTRLSRSWPEDEEDERDNLDEDTKTDFESELFNNGRLNEEYISSFYRENAREISDTEESWDPWEIREIEGWVLLGQE
ncbi:hypothetical protein V6N13_029854 [Hibiscus sabdariffa]|uniref:Uncharacterized protein n=1 Tax=Hibiscus sabdariffa TaxID=183260 RepID=A0ABR2T965_9ROSI